MKKLDALRQFVALRELLQKEKAQHEARLSEIKRALDAAGGFSQPVARSGRTPASRARTARRIKNPISHPKRFCNSRQAGRDSNRRFFRK
jgi:hypothetical protein